MAFIMDDGNFYECLSQRHRGHRVLGNSYPLLCVLCASVRNFVKSLTFSLKDYTVLICTQTPPSQNSEKFCAEAMFCQILTKLFSHILLFIITCKSGVYACVSSMLEKCAGNERKRKNLGITHRRLMGFVK